jgi:hypothetical protein
MVSEECVTEMIEGNSARFRSSEREQVQMRIVPAMAASSVKMKMGVKNWRS